MGQLMSVQVNRDWRLSDPGLQRICTCLQWSPGQQRKQLSPDLSKHRAGSDGDEHRLQVGTTHHLNLTLLDDVHLPADLTLTNTNTHTKQVNTAAAVMVNNLNRSVCVCVCVYMFTFLQTKSPGRYTTDFSLVSMSNTICLSQPCQTDRGHRQTDTDRCKQINNFSILFLF